MKLRPTPYGEHRDEITCRNSGQSLIEAVIVIPLVLVLAVSSLFLIELQLTRLRLAIVLRNAGRMAGQVGRTQSPAAWRTYTLSTAESVGLDPERLSIRTTSVGLYRAHVEYQVDVPVPLVPFLSDKTTIKMKGAEIP